MYDAYGEIRVILQDLPASVRGFCYHDDDGSPYIVLNARLSEEARRRAYRHEMKHIESGDMYNSDYTEYGGAANG